MTKEEFIDQYCGKSLASKQFILANMDAYPCDCGDQYCLGWQMLTHKGAQVMREMGLLPEESNCVKTT